MSEMIDRITDGIWPTVHDTIGRGDVADIVWKTIAAMREPTAAMIEAGNDVCMSFWAYDPPTPNAGAGWRAMIDEALKE